MAASNLHTDIRTLLNAGRTSEAKALAAKRMEETPDADLHYLYGLACARQGEYHHAMNAFHRAESLDPDSPAVHAKDMLDGIYAFRNTDMINP